MRSATDLRMVAPEATAYDSNLRHSHPSWPGFVRTAREVPAILGKGTWESRLDSCVPARLGYNEGRWVL
jgi:hypothetical protein